ncbi:MAG: FG-GAP-like repeat-containing protein [Akkermansiaceae bacterium]
MSLEDLRKVLKYYQASAPEEPQPIEGAAMPYPESPLFRPREEVFLPRSGQITSLKFDEKKKHLYVADGEAHAVWVFSPKGEVLEVHPTMGTEAIDILVREDGFECTLVGHLKWAHENGGVMKTVLPKEGKPSSTTLVTGLPRTAHSSRGDLNGDGREDILTSGFGSGFKGGLFAHFLQSDGTYLQRNLWEMNGFLQGEIEDLDGDGDLDILTMRAQGMHMLAWLENDGSGTFTNHLIWNEKASYGANGFIYQDMNGDGRKDLIVYCGNNMEMRNPPVRPYHGIFVYENLGAMRFKQAAFQALPGAVSAVVRDFDHDGQLDIAAISSCPDWRADSPTSFVLMRGAGGLHFTTQKVAVTDGGMWMAIEAGDLDGDGDQDLILGLNVFPPPATLEENLVRLKKATAEKPTIMVLENTLK